MNTFKDFYSRQRQKFFSYLVRRSGNYDQACDILQESFTRLIEKYPPEHFTPQLLFTIGRNLMRDALRRNRGSAPLSIEKEHATGDPNHVELVGSFSGWGKIPLKSAGRSGYWEVTVDLPEGDHRFSYIVEGSRRLADPTIGVRETDDFGGENSILSVRL